MIAPSPDLTAAPAADLLRLAIQRLTHPAHEQSEHPTMQGAASIILRAALARDTARDPEARLFTSAEDRALQAYAARDVDNESNLRWIETQTGLHRHVEIFDLVDGYEISFLAQDGDVMIGVAHEKTLEEAIEQARRAHDATGVLPTIEASDPIVARLPRRELVESAISTRAALVDAQRALQALASGTRLATDPGADAAGEHTARLAAARAASDAASRALYGFVRPC
jgi:hypothetical protein